MKQPRTIQLTIVYDALVDASANAIISQMNEMKLTKFDMVNMVSHPTYDGGIPWIRSIEVINDQLHITVSGYSKKDEIIPLQHFTNAPAVAIEILEQLEEEAEYQSDFGKN